MLGIPKNHSVCIHDATTALQSLVLLFNEHGLSYDRTDLIDGLLFMLHKSFTDYGYVVATAAPNNPRICRLLSNAHTTLPTILDDFDNLLLGTNAYGDNDVSFTVNQVNMLVVTYKRDKHGSRSNVDYRHL